MDTLQCPIIELRNDTVKCPITIHIGRGPVQFIQTRQDCVTADKAGVYIELSLLFGIFFNQISECEADAFQCLF